MHASFSHKKQTLRVIYTRKVSRTIYAGYFGESSSVDLSLKEARSAAASSDNVPLSKANCPSKFIRCARFILLFLIKCKRSIFTHPFFRRSREFAFGAVTSSLKRNRPHISRESRNRERKNTLYIQSIYLVTKIYIDHSFFRLLSSSLSLSLPPSNIKTARKLQESVGIDKINVPLELRTSRNSDSPTFLPLNFPQQIKHFQQLKQ